MPSRRFLPPWTVKEQASCFVARDHSGQQLAYLYFEEEPGWRSTAKLLTRGEARRQKVFRCPPGTVDVKFDRLTKPQNCVGSHFLDCLFREY